MRLVCPECSAQYEVEDGAIPEAGRDVQCSDCGYGWFQRRPDALPQKTLVARIPAAPGRAATDPAPVENATPRPAPSRKPLDENVMAILRAEALREAVARREEAARKSGRAPLPAFAPDGPPRTVPEAPTARPDEAAAMAPVAPQMAAARSTALPDIEAITSSLASGNLQRGADPAPPPDPRRGFRAGFGVMALLAGLAAAAYVLAPRIAAAVPEASDAMTAYVGTVDHLRRQLDATVATAQRQVEALLLSVV